ncbi:hypothetical protein CONLIGDRAFT_687131 [Coniochaeta ligniaria NRRL 30616]|uniref:Uncharacterized protein n=1 Tax=Coniochaeta ligniaria NRRL 30616 TaxID=1408157 RepID=A0A1J7IPL3_9PEZI|nr:hypothetical protein CONLIGDRAFT_687131 [Coniochaeta ligniaria NRRL 30616]
MTNSTAFCPAVATTGATFGGDIHPYVDHIACYGAYQTGVAGDNTSYALRTCCNSTVDVVRDESIAVRNGTDCFFYCNVTRSPEYGFDDDSANGFWKIQQCIEDNSGNIDYDALPGYAGNRYNIRCIPRQEKRSATVNVASHSLGSLGVGLILLVASWGLLA